jgi:hypothetical protein
MRATHPRYRNRGGEPHHRTVTQPQTLAERDTTEIQFDLDEEVEKRAELALARRHRLLSVAESKHPRF